jgi:predicted GNAT superfamily acetyltransferase
MQRYHLIGGNRKEQTAEDMNAAYAKGYEFLSMAVSADGFFYVVMENTSALKPTPRQS